MKTSSHEMLDLYNSIFKDLQTDEDTFSERLKLNKGSVVFEQRDNNLLLGYSVLNYDGILLLCVDKNHRNKGIGSKLLKQSENHIMKNFDKVTLGLSKNTYLFCGVPLGEDYDSQSFFQKRGYSDNGISFDMTIDLSKYSHKQELDSHNDNIIIRRRRKDIEDLEKAKKCGDAIQMGWGDIYKESSDLIVAEVDGEIVGGVIVDPDSCMFTKSIKDAGTIGCVGVTKEYREHGVGMTLSQHAVSSLKDSGCKTCFIGYTYLDKWYGKLGAIKYVDYWKGYKDIR